MKSKLLSVFLFGLILQLFNPVHAQTIDPVRLTLTTSAQQVGPGEDVTITIKAQYLNVPAKTAFIFNESNSFKLKLVLPEGFVQTGGDYYDYAGAKLSPSSPIRTYTMVGHFAAQSNDRDFKLLRGGSNANDRSQYKLAAKLIFSVAEPENAMRDSSARQSAVYDFETNGSLLYMTMAQLRAGLANQASVIYITDEGKEGMFFHDPSDSSTDDGSVVVVENGHRYLRKIQNSTVNVEFFGAKGDYNDATGAGKDNTEAFQKAIDYLIKVGGGVLEIPNKKYKISGSVNVNPLSHISITIRGSVLNTRPNGNVLGLPVLVKDTNGDMFRINLKTDGSGNIPYPDSYASLAVSGLEVKARDVSLNVTGFKMWRTRVIMQGVSASNLSYLVLQNDRDSADNSNYCDHSRFQDIRIANSRFGGLRLYASDATVISGLYLESTTPSFNSLLTIRATRSISINGVNFWTPTAHTVAGVDSSKIFDIRSSKGVSIENVHIERAWTKDIFYFVSCDGIQVSGLTTEFSYRNAFRFRFDNKNVSISNWSAKANVIPGGSDIAIDEGLSHKPFTLNNLNLLNEDGTTRALSVNNASGIATEILVRKYSSVPYDYDEKNLTNSVLISENGSVTVPGTGYTVFLSDVSGGNNSMLLNLPALPTTREGRIKVVNRSTSTTWSVPDSTVESIDERQSFLIPKGSTIEFIPGTDRWLVDHVAYSYGIKNWNTVHTSKFVSGGANAANAPVATNGAGIQSIVGDVPGTKKQLINFGGNWYKRDITNNVAGNWYRMFDEQSVIREQSLTKTANYQILDTDFGNNGQLTIYADASAGAIILTCPTAVKMNRLILNVIKTDVSTNTVTVKAAGTELINGSNTDAISAPYATKVYRSNGTQIFKF